MKYDFLTLSRPRSRALEDPKKEMQKKKKILQNSQKNFSLILTEYTLNQKQHFFPACLKIA